MAIRDALSEAVLAAVPVAILFFSGWAYLSIYLAHFAVDITELELPLSTMLVFAAKPFNSAAALGLIIAFVLLVGFVMWLIAPLTGLLRQVVAATGIVLLVFLVAKAVLTLADRAAQQASQQVWDGRRARSDVALAPAASRTLLQRDYDACLARRGFVNVLSTIDRSFLLCRDSKAPTKGGMLYIVQQPGILVSRRRVENLR